MLGDLTEVARNVGLGLYNVGIALGRAGKVTGYFIRDTARAHYNIIGRYTAPIESEFLGTNPPSPKNLNVLGQFALTLIPITILSWLIALTIAPLIYNSLRFIKMVFLNTANLVLLDLPEETQIGLSEEEMANYRKIAWYRYIYGFPGLLLSGFLGLVAAGFIALGRIASNSFESFWRTAYHVSNLALEEEDRETTFGLEGDHRKLWQTYGFGLIGFLLGMALGCLGFLLVILARVVKNSYRSFIYSFATTTNLALDDEDELKDYDWEKDDRESYLSLGFGFIGGVLGFAFGLLSVSLVLLARTASNSFENILRVTLSGLNLIRHEEVVLDSLKDDLRNNVRTFILGFPGLILGIFTGFLGISYAIFERSIIESLKTISELFVNITAQAFSSNQQDPDFTAESRFKLHMPSFVDRSLLDRVIFGVWGIVPGIVFGFMGFLVVGGIRIVSNSFNTGIRTFLPIANLGLDEKTNETIRSSEFEKMNTRSWGAKYILGFPGLFLGTLVGILTLASIVMVKGAIHSYHSWLSLSGSIANGSLEYPLSKGLNGDNRLPNHKAYGVLGYLLAVTTTLPLGILVFAARKLFFTIIPALAAIVVAPIKWGKLVFQPRFEENNEQKQSVDQTQKNTIEIENRFKNLYSSLSTWGQFNEEEMINDNQNGRKGPACFARKAFTLDKPSVTEHVLDSLLEGYRTSENKDSFFDDEDNYRAVLKVADGNYKKYNCLEPDYQAKTRENQIKDLGAFVKEYIQNKTPKVPAGLYSKHEKSWSTLFWGRTESEESFQDLRNELDKRFGSV